MIFQVRELIRNKDIYGAGLFLLLIVLIGYQEMISPAIGIFILIVFAEFIFFRSLKFVFNPALILFAGLFLLYLIGLIWSDHREIGWKLMEYKLSFFIFPLLFLFPKVKTDYSICLRGLVWGCLLLTARFVFEKINSDVDMPYYEIARQNLNLHPTYVAIYYASAVVFLFWHFKKAAFRKKFWIIFPTIIFSYAVIATGSFAGILFLGILVALGTGYLIFLKLGKLVLFFYVISAPFLIYFGLTQLKSLSYDLEIVAQLRTEISEGKIAFLEKNKTQVSGTRERVMLWYISSEIIGENPIGVGTGDIDFYLQKKCDKYDLQVLKNQNLNPHNQFLQIGIDLGWLGIFYLVGVLLWIFIKGVNGRNWFMILTIVSLGFNALFESVLQRQSGIVFYTLILCILLVIEKRDSAVSSIEN